MSEQALPEEDRVRPSSEGRHLWFALLGAAIAWFIHFMACYLLLEVACVLGWQQQQLLGLNGVAAAIVLTTLVCLPLAVASGVVAWRATADRNSAEHATYLGQAGMMLSVLFVGIIVFETLPALVLPPCPFG